MKRSLMFGLLSPLFLNACAALQQGDALYEEKNLEKAGFHVTTVDTPSQRAALAKMTPYELQPRVEKGRTVYRYADPREQKIYSGGPVSLRPTSGSQSANNRTIPSVSPPGQIGPEKRS